MYTHLKDYIFTTVLFDETLNGVIQESPMDVCMHFWDVSTPQVCTRYFSPEFLGHAAGDELQN